MTEYVAVSPDLAWRIERPQDKPDESTQCKKCKKWKPETEKNFESYKSRNLWYRRPTCKQCREDQKHQVKEDDQTYSARRVSSWRSAPYISRGPAGQILVEIEERFRVFIEQVRATEERYKNPNAIPFWTERLAAISGLTEEASAEVLGETIDRLIEEFRSDTEKESGL